MDHVEPLGDAVRGQLAHVVRPPQPPAEPHPPRVAQPQERRAVGVLQVAPVGRRPDRAVPEQGIGLVLVGGDLELARKPVQAGVGAVRAAGAPAVHSRQRRGVARPPSGAARPEGGDRPVLPVRAGDDQVERDVVERVRVLDGRLEAPLGDVVHAAGALVRMHGGEYTRPSIVAAPGIYWSASTARTGGSSADTAGPSEDDPSGTQNSLAYARSSCRWWLREKKISGDAR